MRRTFPLPACLASRLTFPAPVARALCALLVLAGLVAAPSPVSAAGESASAHPPAVAAARRLLYPRWDPASGLAGEPFRSPSLGLEAADMRLADFQVAAVPGRAQPSRFVAAALLEPQGFPVPYTLLEVAVLEHGDAGLRLVDNLKVRVDSGGGPGGLRMHLPRPGAPAGQDLRFEVRVTDAAGSLRHRFRQDRAGIALVESIIAR